MKNRIMIFALAAMALMAVGCQKDGLDGRLLLLVEGYNSDTKLAINGTASDWADGDKVRVNGKVGTVQITGSGTTVDIADEFTAPYYGVYPSTIYGSNDGSSYTLNLPATYTYAVTGGTQNLGSPMVAYAANGNTLVFKHLTAAVTVHFVNYYGFTVEIDSIVVSSNKYKLSGTLSGLTIDGNDPAVTYAEAATDAEKKVKMIGGSSLRVFAGDSINVQVPVLPVGSDNKFTIKVKVHKVDQSAVDTTFEKTQASGGALARKQIGYARMTTPGLFSVSASKKVVISQGNLQYQASTGTWKFSETQYGSIGNAAGNNVFDDTRFTQEAWIDLFGWGTSGWNNGNTYYMPYDTTGSVSSSSGYGYGPKNGYSYISNITGDYANADWGVKNRIFNGGNQAGRWRTLTGGSSAETSEWMYLISSREASTVSGVTNARCAKASVASTYGYILFPDNYEQPEGIDAPKAGGINPSAYIGWTDSRISSFSADQWYKMEAAGAIFLPSTGYRTYGYSAPFAISYTANNGYYWSSTCASSGNAYCEQLGTGTPANSSIAKRCGLFVRLVRDVD